MTTVLDTIAGALRACRVLGAGRTPKAPDAAFGLEAFQNLIDHLAGYGASYEWTDARCDSAEEISVDEPGARRQVKTSAGAITITLPRQPRDGARFAVVDVDRTFDTNNLTINSNGMRFDATLDANGAPTGGSITTTALSTQGLVRSWMYRADLGAWIRLSELTLSSFVPYPVEFNRSFKAMLAVEMKDEYGVDLSDETLRHADIGYARLSSRYVDVLPSYCDAALLRGNRAGRGSIENV